MLGLHPLERTKMIAAIVGLAGVALIFSGELRLGAPPLALLGVFTGASCASLSGVILKKIPPHSTFAVNGIGAVVGASVCFVASVATGETHTLPSTFEAWGPILYLAVAGNLGAYVLWTWLVTQWRVTSVTVGALIVPVIAVLVGAMVRAESPAPLTYAGAALVLGGVAFALFAPVGERPAQAR
jgi:drug/metabolite transporter (DMT)-like permease